ncbi:hypothetical protein D3C72_1934850 [compost metagenome]
MVYYIVKISNLEEMKISTSDISRFEWIDVNENPFVLPIDKIALAKYRERFNILNQ